MAEYQKEDLKKIYLIKSEYEKSHGSCAKFRNALSRFNTCLKNDNFSEKDIEDLLKARYKGNWIASVGQGNDEYQQVRKNWDSIYKAIKELKNFDFEQEHPDKLVAKYQELLDVVSQGCKRKKRIITNRLLVTFFPQYVTTTCDNNDFQTIAKFMNKNFGNYQKPQENWLLDNLDFVKYCRESFTEYESLPIAYFAWYLHEDIENKDIYKLLEDKTMTDKNTNTSDLVKLLKSTKNIILHGAPGTGKTYLAKQIAQQMIFGKVKQELSDEEQKIFNEQVELVQFHPSYDYTDFVEGIRPTPDGKFKLEDGILKKFCKKALKKTNIDNFTSVWNQLVETLKDKKIINIPFLSKVGTFEIELNNDGSGLRSPREKWTSFLNWEHLYNVYKGLPGMPKAGQDNYMKAILNYMKDNMGLLEYKEEQPFIFIIDEINRGEMSKIFGELFYSIDPGYRVDVSKIEKEKPVTIRTQYANMQDEQNLFDETLGITDSDNFGHFFVPDNVYIIGTMNDIDRSVESMDFAMRRRFTFQEIKTADNTGMLDELDAETRNQAIEKMKNLNDAIVSEEFGLSSGYQIGAAYFLKLKDLNNNFKLLWEYHLAPLLKEYLRGQDPNGEKLKKLEDAYKSEGNDTEPKK